MTDKARLVLLPEGWVAVPTSDSDVELSYLSAIVRQWLEDHGDIASYRSLDLWNRLLAAAPSLPEPDTAGSREALQALADQAQELGLYNQAVNACKRQLELQQRIGRDECCLDSIQRCIDDVQRLLKNGDNE